MGNSTHRDAMYEIIDLCNTIDILAKKTYEDMYKIFSDNPELREFWKEMIDAEDEHILFWQSLLPIAQKGHIPPIFDNPEKVKEELFHILDCVKELEKSCCKVDEPHKAFLMSYRLEFYLLHPAFEHLYHFAKDLQSVLEVSIPTLDYNDHITCLIEALNRFGASTPEMELLGETLMRMWTENRELAIRSNTDSLTGMLNRRGFIQAVKPLAHFAERYSYRVAVLMVDIDDFKKINDSYGHRIGDTVLKSVGEVVKGSLRKSDICARYGGEEFIVFTANMDKDSLLEVGEKIRKSIMESGSNGIKVTVSIGAYSGVIDQDIDTMINVFIDKADVALYRAKREGKNRVIIQD